MFWLGLIIPISYVPLWTGHDILTGWSVLSIVLPWLFLRRVQLGIGHWLGIAFLAYATFSLLWTENHAQAVWDLWLLYLLAGCFLLGASRDPRPLYLGCALGIGISDLVAVPQAFGWQGVFALSSAHPTGLFINPDMFGEAAALATVALIVTNQWWPLIFTVPPILFTGCRSAALACFICAVFWLWNRYRLLSIPALAIAFLGALAWHHGWDGSEALRVAMWQDTLGGLTWFGHGPGSFFALYPEFANHTDTMFTRPESAHNDFLELAFEFGVGVIPLFILITFSLWTSRVDRYILLAFCAIAFVSFPIRLPTEGLLGMVALGSLCRDWSLAWSYRHLRGSVAYLWALRPSREALSLEPIHSHSAGVCSNHT